MLYTALTTIVAFASLILSDIKPVSDFGYMMTFGLIVTFLTSFILLPCILSLLEKEERNNYENKPFRFTKFLADLTINKGPIYCHNYTYYFTINNLWGSQLRS